MHPYQLVHLADADADADADAAPETEGGGRRRWWGLAFLCLTALISGFDMTVTNLALPQIATALDADTSDLQLVVDSYLITLAGLLLLGSGLADRYGRKGVTLLGLLLFGLASTAAAWCRSPEQLVAARAVMGVGAALFLPPTFSILTVMFGKAERTKAVGLFAAYGGAGLALGPIVAGLLLDKLWWGSVFLINVPCVLVAVVGVALLVPTSRRPHTPRLDWVGATLSVAGLAAFLYGVIVGPEQGWTAPGTLVSLGAGLALIAAFVGWELRTRYPMFEVRVFRIPELDAGAIALFLLYLTFIGLLFLVPQYLQQVRGNSATTAGLLLAPLGATFACTSVFSARVLGRFGIRRTLVVALLLMAAGSLVMALVDVAADAAVVVGGVVFGVGISFCMPPASTAVINALPVAQAGDGADVNMVARQVGGAFGTAVLGSVFASVLAGTGSRTEATQVGLAVSAAVAVLGAVAVALLLRRRQDPAVSSLPAARVSPERHSTSPATPESDSATRRPPSPGSG